MIPTGQPLRERSAWRRLLVWILVSAVLVLGGTLVWRWRESQRIELEHKADLLQFALAYHEYYGLKGEGPASMEEMVAIPGIAARLERCPFAIDGIRSGDLAVVWNAHFFQNGDESENYILAYERKVPREGGLIIRGGGSVHRINADEFQTLPTLPPEFEPLLGPNGEPRLVTWTRHRTPDGNCSAEFPWPPFSERLEFGLAGEVERLILKRPPGRGLYLLSKVESPDDREVSPTEFFDGWRDNMLAMTGPDGGEFKFLTETSSPQGGVAGRRIDFRVGNRVSLNRIFVVGRTAYRANVVVDADKSDDADAQRFLGSVRFP